MATEVRWRTDSPATPHSAQFAQPEPLCPGFQAEHLIPQVAVRETGVLCSSGAWAWHHTGAFAGHSLGYPGEHIKWAGRLAKPMLFCHFRNA